MAGYKSLQKDFHMYHLTENTIFQAINNNETITVKPKELNFCMRIPLTEGENLTVKDFVIIIFLESLRHLPSGCEISLVNQKRNSREFKFDKLKRNYKEICEEINKEKEKLRQCQDWKNATAYYYFEQDGPFINFCYEIVKNCC